MRKTLTLLIALTYTVLAQTTVALGRQARNIDFSNSPFTKTFKTGTALPSTCSQGETYLKLDAQTGQNIYACTSANIWAQQGVPAEAEPQSFEWTRTSATQAQLSQGSFRFGNSVTNITATGLFTLQGSPTGTIWIYAAAAGSIVAAHNLGAGNLNVSGTGYTVDALGNGFPASSLPFYRCPVTSGVLPVWYRSSCAFECQLSYRRPFRRCQCRLFPWKYMYRRPDAGSGSDDDLGKCLLRTEFFLPPQIACWQHPGFPAVRQLGRCRESLDTNRRYFGTAVVYLRRRSRVALTSCTG